ncbi:MAG TPA: CoA-transferase [bacterium]|nr:CoA-transferase [bacterium]
MSKVLTSDEVVARIPDGALVAIGGSSLSRKPMVLVRALARSNRRDLRLIVNVGGPEVDLLIGTGKVAELIYAFVGFEVMGLAPHFRRARQDGTVKFQEWSEFTIMAGLDATIKRVPFLPTHSLLATDVLKVNPAFKLFQDPFKGETLVAVPALRPDVALLHVNLADPQGNGVVLGDGHMDALCAKAAAQTFLSAEQILLPERLQTYGRDVHIFRTVVNGVVDARWGAHFTGCAPDYRADLNHVREYLAAARDRSSWHEYLEKYVYVDDREYTKRLGGEHTLGERLRV